MHSANGVTFEHLRNRYQQLVKEGIKQQYYDIESLTDTLKAESVLWPRFTSGNLARPTASKRRSDEAVKAFSDWLDSHYPLRSSIPQAWEANLRGWLEECVEDLKDKKHRWERQKRVVRFLLLAGIAVLHLVMAFVGSYLLTKYKDGVLSGFFNQLSITGISFFNQLFIIGISKSKKAGKITAEKSKKRRKNCPSGLTDLLPATTEAFMVQTSLPF